MLPFVKSVLRRWVDNTNGARMIEFAANGKRMALVVAILGAACGDQQAAGPLAGHSVYIVTADLSTGTRTATIIVSQDGSEIHPDVLAQFAPRIQVLTWPAGEPAAATERTSVVRGDGQLPNGAEQEPGYGQIDRELDGGLDGNAWYSVSIEALPWGYSWDKSELFAFAGGALGIRISPTHPPVVGSLLSCQKEGAVAVYVRFSEPITSAPGAVQLDYGAATPCTIGGKVTDEIQFICTGAEPTGPFSIHVGDSVVGQMSGSPMAAGTIQSGAMQVAVRTDGCMHYKPLVPGAAVP
jgi:hypothetical protein